MDGNVSVILPKDFSRLCILFTNIGFICKRVLLKNVQIWYTRVILYTLFCVNLDPNPEQNDWKSAMRDCKSFLLSMETKEEESIKLGNLKFKKII